MIVPNSLSITRSRDKEIEDVLDSDHYNDGIKIIENRNWKVIPMPMRELSSLIELISLATNVKNLDPLRKSKTVNYSSQRLKNFRFTNMKEMKSKWQVL